MAGPIDHSAGSDQVDFDFAIIGAGISGLNIAYYIQTYAPGKSYVILDARDRIGGTWDLFRYPGIRSDSDIFTFGFSWNAWTKERALAEGDEILEYLDQSAAKFGIDKHIRFCHRVETADWSSKRSAWTLRARVKDDESITLNARFMVLGTGYYDHQEAMHTVIPGIENFSGPVIQPQFWPRDLDYTNKNVVIIGSGATAVTLLPSMADKAKHVTMLQRSPSYVAAMPNRGGIVKTIRSWLPGPLAWRMIRYLFVIRGYMMYYYCTIFPGAARKALQKAAVKQLPPNVPWDPHFKPRYNPWEQRLCACPDGDFFAALRCGKGSVVTDTIETITENEIQLTSGQRLHPDIIIAATGLKMSFAGRIKISIDGETLDPSSKFIWNGALLQDVPNLMFVFGYANASWTLAVDVAASVLIRVMRQLDRKKAKVVIPRLANPEKMQQQNLIALTSTYVQSAVKAFPKAGTGQWKGRTNYFLDMFRARWGDMTSGLEFW